MATASAKRYARAVFELAVEENEVEAWAERLAAVQALLTHPDARRLFMNPAVPPARRMEAVDQLASEAMGERGRNLAKLLVEGGRVDSIDGIVDEYTNLADLRAGRVRATVTTAVELDAADRGRLAKDLSTRLGKDVRVEARVDPDILGGMVVQFGDRLVDASLAARLQQLRRRIATG